LFPAKRDCGSSLSACPLWQPEAMRAGRKVMKKKNPDNPVNPVKKRISYDMIYGIFPQV
jgi:hypothetical protein